MGAAQAQARSRLAGNDADKAYYRGYLSGVSRAIAGAPDPNELEAIAFELLQDAPGRLVQLLGRGYRDGLEGKAIAL